MRLLPRMVAALILLLLAGSPAAFAHATLVRSTPADQAIVHSHEIDMALEYNSRIEASRCTVTLTDSAGKKVPLQMEHSVKPSELKAVVRNLKDGPYQIHWQVLASDGHITRGDVAFTVSAQLGYKPFRQ
ncbi:MAG: copper resistance CopC family protein [Acidobacteriaceae bacterium]